MAFPDCQVSGTLPPSIQPELVLDAGRLRDGDGAVRRVFESFRRAHHRELRDREIESVREALYPRYELVPVVWRKIEDQEERLRRLTEQQHRLLDYLAHQPKAAIRGVAGSGKTMPALAKAQREARAGRRTLLLCYNQPLQDWLKAAVPESFANELVVLNYHSLASRLCQEAGVPLWERRERNDQDFWDVQAAEALIEACDVLGPEHKFHLGCECRSESCERGRILHIAPANAMNPGEVEPGIGRTDPERPPIANAVAFHDCQSDGAGAISTKVGGFEVDPYKCSHKSARIPRPPSMEAQADLRAAENFIGARSGRPIGVCKRGDAIKHHVQGTTIT